MTEQNKFPTEIIDLPSGGHFYPSDNLLSNGKVELKYMGAKEEDILTSKSLLQRGQAIDVLLKSVIVTPIQYESLLIGDKNAIMVATRILAYGKDYTVDVTCPSCDEKSRVNIDLTKLEHKKIDLTSYEKGVNEFFWELPKSKRKITFKLLTQRDEEEIDVELKGLKKITKETGIDAEISTRLKKLITSIDGNRKYEVISKFVDKEMLSLDSFELRKHIISFSPDVDMEFYFSCGNSSCGYENVTSVPLTTEFFWPAGRR